MLRFSGSFGELELKYEWNPSVHVYTLIQCRRAQTVAILSFVGGIVSDHIRNKMDFEPISHRCTETL